MVPRGSPVCSTALLLVFPVSSAGCDAGTAGAWALVTLLAFIVGVVLGAAAVMGGR
jgi:hypothetical protein